MLILEAVLDLLATDGPRSVGMEAVAARAGVGKTTIYRRWTSVTDLIADALDTLAFPTAGTSTARTLHEDLVEGLVTASGCLDERRRRVIAGALQVARHQPDLVATLTQRFVAAVTSAIVTAAQRAADRGELTPETAQRLRTTPEPMEVTTVLALLTYFGHAERPMVHHDIERIVDEILVPLLQAQKHTDPS